MPDLNALEKRFDKHISIYAANGKESKRVADALERLIQYNSERDVKVDEMYALFNDGKTATKITKWVFTFIMATGGAFLLFKNILKL